MKSDDKTYVWDGSAQFVPVLGRTIQRGELFQCTESVAISLGSRVKVPDTTEEVNDDE